MAVDLQKLKRKMRGVTSTRQVTRALQMVSAMKMRKAQEQSSRSRVYRSGLTQLMNSFRTPPGRVAPELAESSDGTSTLLVTFASDRGLCGPYNTNILNAVAKTAREVGMENLDIFSIGMKVGSVLRRRRYPVLSNERRPAESERETLLKDLSHRLIEAWKSGKYRSIYLVYSSISGMTVRKPEPARWLPIAEESSEGAVDGEVDEGDYIDEPSPEVVLAESVRRYMDNELVAAILQSEASEHVARMVAMDNATRNAEEIFASLQLTYNKARQAKITQEICEIVAGANAVG